MRTDFLIVLVEIQQEVIILNILNNFFTVRVVKQWHRLPMGMVDVLCLETLKALSNLVQWKVFLLIPRALD